MTFCGSFRGTYSSGYCTGFAPVSLHHFAAAKIHFFCTFAAAIAKDNHHVRTNQLRRDIQHLPRDVRYHRHHWFHSHFCLHARQGDENQTLAAALILFVGFYFLGDALLKLFGIDMPSFAVAGSIVLFILAFEMILGRDIIKNEPTSSGASIVPIAFPLIAGPGAITAFISLHAEYATVNIMIGLAINIVIDYIVLRYLDKISRWLGADVIYVLRKFFGVILLAMAIKLFSNNILAIVHGAVIG